MAGLLALGLLALIIGLALQFEPLVYLFYALTGIFLANRFWLRRSLGALRGVRRLGVISGEGVVGASDLSAFLGDRVQVAVEIANDGPLPLAYAVVEERLPAALRAVGASRWVMSLAPRERRRLGYTFGCARRGYYAIGPLTASGGTPWEAERGATTLAEVTHFTVYPLIVPLPDLGLPSRLPLGSQRNPNPLLPDPSRLAGIRAYQPGDRLRDIHWGATARLGALQVKKFDPSKPLQVAIFLDLEYERYDFRTRERASELAIVVAASVANHIVERRQAVGLICNGFDPLAEGRTTDEVAVPVAAAAPEAAPVAEPEPVVVALPATDRLIAAALPAPAPPRRVIATDPLAPPTLPEATHDEDASMFIDGPATSVPLAAPIVVPIHDGRAHLGILLATLARVTVREFVAEVAEREPAHAPAVPLGRLVRRRAAGLPWGTTLVLITSTPTTELLTRMLGLRAAGFSPVAIFVERPRGVGALEVAAFQAAGLPAHEVVDEGVLGQLVFDQR